MCHYHLWKMDPEQAAKFTKVSVCSVFASYEDPTHQNKFVSLAQDLHPSLTGSLSVNTLFRPLRNLFSKPFIQSTEVLLDGSHNQPSQAEQVLNWHTRNATVQNRVLHSIDQKIDKVSHQVSQQDNQLQHLDSTLRNMYTDLQSRVSRLDTDLHQYISQGYFGPDFDNKEREIRRLKDQQDQITRDHFVSTPYIPSPHPYSPSLVFPTQTPPPPIRPPDHSQFFISTGDLFRKYPPLPTEKPSTSKERKTS
ncbi:hypothetical protein Ddye_001026 [Dipteronia dyeriana]|uniref:Uncharacterized protein n=1 Tax=Dipteronia dyeriana TaxID=168575 RepID=A0AAD9XN73_9ROSI|nr:hypothetical protein Ddye_001026 [Dipteronia dyeriana]